MNMERTVETMAVVTPKSAIARRSQISSYKMLQKPEMQKNVNSQATANHLPNAARSHPDCNRLGRDLVA